MSRKLLPLLAIAQFTVILGLAWKIHDLENRPTASSAAETSSRSGKANSTRPDSTVSAGNTPREPSPSESGPLDPQQAAALLAQNRKSEKNLTLRANRAAALIRRLCQSGYAKEAWDLIDPEYGVERNRALEAYFGSAGISAAEFSSRTTGLDTGDRSAALRGYLGQYSARELATLDLSPINFSERLEQGALIDTLNKLLSGSGENGIQDASTANLLLSKAAEWTGANKLRMEDFGNLLKADKNQDHFAQWAITMTLPEEMRMADHTYNGVQPQLIRQMTREDPERMMTMAMTGGGPEERYMHIAFAEWLEADNASAKRWYDSREGSLDTEQQDRTAVAFMRYYVRYGEYERGLEWYNKISGDNWKSALAYEQRNALNGIKKKTEASGK